MQDWRDKLQLQAALLLNKENKIQNNSEKEEAGIHELDSNGSHSKWETATRNSKRLRQYINAVNNMEQATDAKTANTNQTEETVEAKLNIIHVEHKVTK